MAKKGRRGKPERQERVPDGSRAGALEPVPVAIAQDTADVVEPPAQRGWSNALIALFLLVQLALPLRYYLSGGGYDERFSWRMFSTLRMQQCQVKVEETIGERTSRVDLQKAVQIAWIGMLERYRRPVVEKLLARRCAQPDARSARYQRNCTDTDGSALPATVVRMDCASGKLEVEGERSERGAQAQGDAP